MMQQIEITAAASDYIKHMIAKQQGIGMRLSIKKTGCSGYSYAPSIVNQINTNDVKIDFANDVIIFVDPVWQHLLTGITIDYIEEEKTGLKQKKLIFINPNEANRCGCGESFHVE
jgi:iron-sulfur cluster assembly accessory protein